MLNENGLEQKNEVVSNEIPRPTALSNLSKSQKIMAASLAFFALAILILWSVQFKKTLTSGMYPSGQENVDSTTETTTTEDNSSSLKLTDTDKDGLNDYDELNIYKTSPYLEDSDSDGISDKKEMDAGTNPNCPSGRDCADSSALLNGISDEKTTTGNTTNQSTLNNLLDQLGYQKAIGTSTSANADAASLLGNNLDATSLRNLLLENGMDKKILDQISDAQLMQSFQEITSGQ